MSETGKTLLIVGGVVAGAFVLMRVMSPPTTRPAAPAQSGYGALASIVSSIASVAGSSSRPQGLSTGATSNVPGQYIFNSADTKQVGNELVDTATGQSLVYGTD